MGLIVDVDETIGLVTAACLAVVFNAQLRRLSLWSRDIAVSVAFSQHQVHAEGQSDAVILLMGVPPRG
jgi:hypothetical protein